MQLALVLCFGIPIAIADGAHHRIPNIYLIYLAPLAVLSTGFEGIFLLFPIFIFWLLLHFVAGLGMGDVKLLTILALLLRLNALHLFAIYLGMLFVLTSFHAGIVFIRYRTLKAQIPLAPAAIAASVLYLCAPWGVFLTE